MEIDIKTIITTIITAAIIAVVAFFNTIFWQWYDAKFPATLLYTSHKITNFEDQNNNFFIISIFNPSNKELKAGNITQDIELINLRTTVIFEDKLNRSKLLMENSNLNEQDKKELQNSLNNFFGLIKDEHAPPARFQGIQYVNMKKWQPIDTISQQGYKLNLDDKEVIKSGSGVVFAYYGRYMPRIEGMINNKQVRRYYEETSYFKSISYIIMNLAILCLLILLMLNKRCIKTILASTVLAIGALITILKIDDTRYKLPQEFNKNVLFKENLFYN